MDAANSLKQVAFVIELKARFDEERNIQWANELVNAGVHVVHGMVGLKTHAKMAVVVRKEADKNVSYCHIGTGNYNAISSKLYTDLSYLTCRPEITNEVLEAFNFLTGFSLKSDYEHLLVAPISMKTRFLELIERETSLGSKGRIVAKMNQLEDKHIINALYKASQAGVQIDLIIRGFCCLRPGVPGLSETIRVRSILGRFLEHSRVYCFGNGSEDPVKHEYYIGSADWMSRNLQNRVEVVAPICDEDNRRKLRDILQSQLADNTNAWSLQSDGSYVLKKPGKDEEEMSSQKALIKRTARQRAIDPGRSD
jgi:polyphosphate kinase